MNWFPLLGLCSGSFALLCHDDQVIFFVMIVIFNLLIQNVFLLELMLTGQMCDLLIYYFSACLWCSYFSVLSSGSRAGKKFKLLKDLLASSGSSSPIRERTGLSFSAVKSLVLRDKEDKLASGFGDDERVLALIHSLFDAGRFIYVIDRTCVIVVDMFLL